MWCGALVASVVVLAGCAPDGPVQVITAPPSLTASPTPSMGPAAGLPDKPELWDGTGELGAKAAAVWFLRDLYRYVLETNDTAEWERLSTEDCVYCGATVSIARDNADNGYVGRQEAQTRVSVTRVEELNPLTYGVLIEVAQPEVQVYERDSTWVLAYPPNAGQLLLILNREGSDWLLREGEVFGSEESVPPLAEEQR